MDEIHIPRETEKPPPTKKRLSWATVLILALLAAALLWYSRPMGVHDLFPGMEPELIDVLIIKHNEPTLDTSREITEDRYLRLEAGSEDFSNLWTQLEGLRFRRPPTNPLRQMLPFLDGATSKTIDSECYHIIIGMACPRAEGQPWRSEELTFWIDRWEYRDWRHAVTLPLYLSRGKEVGQVLGQQLWEKGTSDLPSGETSENDNLI